MIETIEKYQQEIKKKFNVCYEIAKIARSKNFDPSLNVEIIPTYSLAQRAIGLVSTLHPEIKDERIEKRIKELEKEHGFLDLAVALTIAKEVAEEKFCKFPDKIKAMEAGIRIAIAYLTLGIVSSPIEGFIRLEERKTKDNKTYLAAFFSGPIRSAGGTAAALAIVIIDYIRKIFGYAKYDATEEEVKRGIIEVYDYHERISNLQYLPSEKELEIILRNLPIQIDGDPSEKEVSNYKNLERIKTNKIRKGFCLVVAEGIALKAPKVLKKVLQLKEKGIDLLEDFLWLKELKKDVVKEEEGKVVPSSDYIKDIVGGRPILSYPSRRGGFRLRYGRTRMSGYSATAINPALTYILEDFLAIGTQLRTERPGKSSGLGICDFIEGPIVKLEDESVVKINDINLALKYRNKIKEIIFLGDILISYGDFYNRNHLLIPVGYVEEWWYLELKERLKDIIERSENFEEVKEAQELLDRLGDYNYFNLPFEESVKICKKYKIPLYPKYIFYWTEIDVERLYRLVKWIKEGYFNDNLDFILPYSKFRRNQLKDEKRSLEIIGLEHFVFADNIIIKNQEAFALFLNLGILNSGDVFSKNKEEINKKIKLFEFKAEAKEGKKEDILDFINKHSEFEIRDKAGSFIGARMGRPEKSRPKVLATQPNALFPVGKEGGRLRSFNEALKRGYIKAEFPTFFCVSCNKETIYPYCENCGKETEKRWYCKLCNELYSKDHCVHGKLKPYRTKKIDINYYFTKAREKININGNFLVKGVRGTSSSEHVVENLAKGILRAFYNLPVNKDGTIRYDATEIPLTHFKPFEIGVSVEKLRELGYLYDIYGKPLEKEDQILALMPQDIILPACRESLDERADEFFLRVANFIDDLLVRFYGMQPFYNAKNREDLVGHLMLCIAPHNAAGTVARIIGFSNTQTFLANPFLHGALRRDCDGDEAGFMLLLDALLNFSIKFIPSHIGGTQDCPVICNVVIKQNEVDDMVFDMENVKEYSLELYKAAAKFKLPNEIKIKQVKDSLNSEESFFINYTHPLSSIDLANKCSAYKKLATMKEKVEKQLLIGEKIRAVDIRQLASLIITRHFLRDIRGNLRKFSIQQFRCSICNEKYRRPPLRGMCKCGGRIIFTIAEGTIKKYLQLAEDLANKYDVDEYLKQTIELTKMSVDGIFGKKETKQINLNHFFE
jgi:DNA polymerase II large subunit